MEDWIIWSDAMSYDIKLSDPLSCAIGEFREELLLWIDTELVRLREGEQAEDLVMVEQRAAAGGSQLGASSSRLGVSRGSSHFPSGIAWQEPRTRERVADRDSMGESTRPPIALPDQQTDPEQRPPLSNSRQRLDALARLLEHRLKQAQGPAETSSGAGQGPNTGVEDDSP
jgi:hypothetical protein